MHHSLDIIHLTFSYCAGERPLKWDPMPVDLSGIEFQVALVKLDSLYVSEEYKKVETEFNKTMTRGADYSKIVKIERV